MSGNIAGGWSGPATRNAREDAHAVAHPNASADTANPENGDEDSASASDEADDSVFEDERRSARGPAAKETRNRPRRLTCSTAGGYCSRDCLGLEKRGEAAVHGGEEVDVRDEQRPRAERALAKER